MPRIGQKAASSLFFLLFGALTILLGRDMPIGTAGDMGVGYVPRMLGIGCVGVGLALAVDAIRNRTERLAVDFAYRPALLVTAPVIGFGLLLPWLGLPLTIIALVLAAALSGEAFDGRLLILTALVLAAMSTLMFHTLLRLQVPVWPSLPGLGW